MRLLAVGAHPDDIEFHCGGTLARCVARGDRAFMAVCCDGALGHATIPCAELVPLRAEETRQAAARLGAQVRLLGEPDGWLRADHPTLEKLTQALDWAQPDLVLSHGPDEYHPDHRAAYALTTAVCDLQRIPVLHLDTETGLGDAPQHYVSLEGGFLEIKLAALACHVSQVQWLSDHDQMGLLAWAQNLARLRGAQCGRACAESFRTPSRWRTVRSARLLP